MAGLQASSSSELDGWRLPGIGPLTRAPRTRPLAPAELAPPRLVLASQCSALPCLRTAKSFPPSSELCGPGSGRADNGIHLYPQPVILMLARYAARNWPARQSCGPRRNATCLHAGHRPRGSRILNRLLSWHSPRFGLFAARQSRRQPQVKGTTRVAFELPDEHRSPPPTLSGQGPPPYSLGYLTASHESPPGCRSASSGCELELAFTTSRSPASRPASQPAGR